MGADPLLSPQTIASNLRQQAGCGTFPRPRPMPVPKDLLRRLLQDRDLRATGPRLAVLSALAAQERPVSHSELVQAMGEQDFDQATIYRNLTKLTEVGLARIVSRADGMARYAFTPEEGTAPSHVHPHFLCTDCGEVSCIDEARIEPFAVSPRWREAVAEATLQLQGRCPDCREQ